MRQRVSNYKVNTNDVRTLSEPSQTDVVSRDRTALEPTPSRLVLFQALGRECSSEHGPLAYRLFFRRFILNDVPMLDENAILDANDVRRDRSWFRFEGRREALDKVEEPVAAA